MITREQLEKALDDETKKSFVTKNIDHKVRAITLLRERIPYEECKNILGGAVLIDLNLCLLSHSWYCVPYDGRDGNRKIKAPSACGYWGRKYCT